MVQTVPAKEQAFKSERRKGFKATAPYEEPLTTYLREINRIPMLSRNEETECVQRGSEGNAEAKERLVKANLRFVVSVAKRYQNMGLPLSDLINEGNIGLMKAVEKFDVLRGYHFISYAVWWIKQSILKAISEQSRLIRLPLNKVNELVRIEKIRKQVPFTPKEDDQAGEIAKILHMDPAEVKNLIILSRAPVPLDEPILDEEGSNSYGDFIEDTSLRALEEEPFYQSLRDEINRALNLLSRREAEVIQFRYGLNGRLPESLTQIGTRYHLSKERIRQIERKALDKLRRRLNNPRLRSYHS